MLIVFSGTDGAGKSTQITKLIEHYKNRGEKTKYIWSRGGYTPLFSFLKSLGRKILRKKLPEPGPSSGRDALLQKRGLSKVWLIIAILDLMLLYGLYIRWMSLTGKIVICDRYIDDTKLDFIQNFGGAFNRSGFLWKLLVAVSPEPKKSFLLYVPVDISRKRSIEKNEPFPDTVEVLEFRLANYLDEKFFPSYKYHKVKCTDSIEEIHTTILEKMSS